MATADDVQMNTGPVTFLREGDIVHIGDQNSPYRVDFVTAYGADLTWIHPGRDPVKQNGAMPHRDLKLLRRPVRVGDRIRLRVGERTVGVQHVSASSWHTSDGFQVDITTSGDAYVHADGTEIDLSKPTTTKRIVKVGDWLRDEAERYAATNGMTFVVSRVAEDAVHIGKGIGALCATWLGLAGWTHRDGCAIDVEGTRDAARRTESRAVFAGPGRDAIGWTVGAGVPKRTGTALKLTGLVQDGDGGGKVVVGPGLHFAPLSGERPCGGEILLARTIFKTDPAVIAIVTEKSDCGRVRDIGTYERLQAEGRPAMHTIAIVDRKAYDRAMQIAWERDESGLATAAKKRAAEIVAELREGPPEPPRLFGPDGPVATVRMTSASPTASFGITYDEYEY